MASRILITTDYLRPGDEVDQYLRRLGHETVHAPMRGRRDPDELAEALVDIDAALIANEPMTADVLARAATLRVIVRTGVGYDSVDVAAATRRGITVSNLPGVNANAVAEYTIGVLLAAARGLVRSAAGVRAGGWPREDGHELRGATLGLIGYGAVAQAVVPLARAFGLKILCTTSRPDCRDAVPLDELLAASDYVSIHTALTARTRGLLDAAAFRRMKPTAVLINTARGPIVDEHALVEAVRSGRIAGAALDVVDVEPLPVTSPLRTVDRIVVYSHLAGQSAEARRAAGIEGAAELVAALNGTPRFAVS
ncbi:phosphoglycerate dehydrogenase [Cryptosporangium sp. NPDC051539]|uniref:phosphoglycerate dehydrogenase n=1 Tax=Cryptosporangium sp. NPDC051539 TaxID=3363962 RepID=UPI00379084B4